MSNYYMNIYMNYIIEQMVSEMKQIEKRVPEADTSACILTFWPACGHISLHVDMLTWPETFPYLQTCWRDWEHVGLRANTLAWLGTSGQ